MAKGRPKLPTEVKKMQGTYRADQEVQNPINTTIALKSEPPPELNEWGARYWVSIMEEYTKIGLIKVVDLAALDVLCNEYGTYKEADDIVKAKGLEIEEEIFNQKGELIGTRNVPNPMLKVKNDAYKNFNSMCSKFGLTPSDRAKLEAPKLEDSDPFADF